jgi:hypothetical protein
MPPAIADSDDDGESDILASDGNGEDVTAMERALAAFPSAETKSTGSTGNSCLKNDAEYGNEC